jgi:hypothetical protein
MSSIESSMDPRRHAQGLEDSRPSSALPLLHSVRCLLALCGVITVIAGVTVQQARAEFPPWFSPLAELGLVFFVGLIGWYIWRIHRPEGIAPSGQSGGATWIWVMAVLSPLCASSLHQFAPFRPDMAAVWGDLPPGLQFIRYNFLLTAASLLAVVVLAALHFRGRRRAAATGLVILVYVLLIPNDDCTNAFNRPWISWMGASPLMFWGVSVALLIGYCGLHGIQPRLSVWLMGLINAGMLVLGWGHWTRVIW